MKIRRLPETYPSKKEEKDTISALFALIFSCRVLAVISQRNSFCKVHRALRSARETSAGKADIGETRTERNERTIKWLMSLPLRGIISLQSSSKGNDLAAAGVSGAPVYPRCRNSEIHFVPLRSDSRDVHSKARLPPQSFGQPR